MRRLAERPQNLTFFAAIPDLQEVVQGGTTMGQTAILGAGVMGETLLSGLVRAGRRVDNLLVGEKRPERARELEERYGVAVASNAEAAAQGRHRRARREAAGHGESPRRDRTRAAARAARRLARGRHHHRVHRVAGARGRRRRPGHAEHARARRRGHGRDLARLPLRRRAPRRGGGADGLGRQGAPHPRAPAGRRHRDLRLRAGVHLLRRRVDDRGRRPPRPAALDRHRPGRPDRGRLGQDAARDRHPPRRAARAGHLAGRHHRRRPARARDPQGARGVPRRDGGRARPVAARSPKAADRGRPAAPGLGCDGRRARPALSRRHHARRAGHRPDPRRRRGRPGGARLALAVPDRGGAVLLRLDRQPRPPQPAAS